MPSYLVETYLPRGRAGERTSLDEQARIAAGELAQEQRGVSFQRSIYVPDDEICFFVFDAPASRDVELVARRAGLGLVRVVEAIPSEKEER